MDVRNIVLDTNVILHDALCLSHFGHDNIIIPMIVLEEVDKFKKGDEQRNFQARYFIRKLDSLYTNDVDFHKGVKIGDEFGILKIIAGNDKSDEVSRYFIDDFADHRILALAHNLQYKEKLANVVLVTKDINLRMKAKALGISTSDYTAGTVQNIEEQYLGKREIDNFPNVLLDELYQKHYLDLEVFENRDNQEESPLKANEYALLKSSDASALVRNDPFDQHINLLEKHGAYGIKPRNHEQIFAMDALLDDRVPIVALSGKAGTGKTLLALACALERRTGYKQIYVARPIIPLSNKEIGYLPGDVKSKLNPYMQPLFDNLKVIKNQYSDHDKEVQRINELTESGKLLIEPLAYIRGRSLDRIYFIVDEAQNLTPHEIKTIITRVGNGTKIVLVGDPHQIDTPYLDAKSNGLTYLIDRLAGQKLFAHVTLEKGERSALAELASDLL